MRELCSHLFIFPLSFAPYLVPPASPLSMTHLYRMDKQALRTVVINCQLNNNTTTKRYILSWVLVFSSSLSPD
ncbi:hypothetical protein F5H01DRAFT_334242 [Linnemannia elongata]|nr:hypothetical protein F5H01DRAFT_334242 [Linnemannia elongata]